MSEVVENTSNGSGGCIRASDDKRIALEPEFGHDEALACSGVFSMEQVVEVDFLPPSSPCLVLWRAWTLLSCIDSSRSRTRLGEGILSSLRNGVITILP